MSLLDLISLLCTHDRSSCIPMSRVEMLKNEQAVLLHGDRSGGCSMNPLVSLGC